MNSIGTLVGVRFVGAQKPLVQALGLNCAVFLNECLFWQSKVGIGNWWSRTIPQLTDDTGLSKSEQATVRDKLIKLKLIEEQKGVQYRTQTRVNETVFNQFLTEIQPQESDRLESSAAENLSASRSKPVGSYNREVTENSNELQQDDESALSSGTKGNPFDYWSAYCIARGLPVNHLVGNQLQRQLHSAKLIMTDGITVQDTHNCTAWLHSQEWWRNKGFTLNDVRNQYGKWAGLGKPKAEKVTGAKQIRGATPSL